MEGTTRTHSDDGMTPLLDMDELGTRISYYVLYTAGANDNNNIVATNGDNEEPEKNGSSHQQDADELFWQEDEWTQEDLDRAQTMLDKEKDLCNISSNHTYNHAKLLDNYKSGSNMAWDLFYKTHGSKFFKDRHYLDNAFEDEFPKQQQHDSHKVVVEIGCGVGNTVLPLLEQYPKWIVWGFDYSPTAIEVLQRDERYVQARSNQTELRAHVQIWDITSNTLPPVVSQIQDTADVCCLLFCLSAVAPKDMVAAVKNVASLLKTQRGTLVFRDYGRYDQAQLQLGSSRGKGLGDNWYVKHDGTRCYYFDLQDLERIFVHGAGLEALELKYIRRIYRNRANNHANQSRRRVWVQGRFRKPAR